MINSEEKYKQKHHTPLLQFPLIGDFGFKRLAISAQSVLGGVYGSSEEQDPYVTDLMPHLQMPQSVRDLENTTMNITVEGCIGFKKNSRKPPHVTQVHFHSPP